MSYIETQIADHIATITLNRPDKLNAFTGTMREDLLDAFCAGGDVAYMASLQASNDQASFRKLLDAGRDVVLEIATMAKPVIASVNGVAAGAGCNLALACDYRIASEQAKLGETFIRIGRHPDWGGTWLLPRLVGRGRATELMMTGRMVDAQEALAIGMVDRVVASLEEETT